MGIKLGSNRNNTPYSRLQKKGLIAPNAPLEHNEGAEGHTHPEGGPTTQSTTIPKGHSSRVQEEITKHVKEGGTIDKPTVTRPGGASTVLDWPAPETKVVPEKKDEKVTSTKQISPVSVPRKGLGKILGKYKTIEMPSSVTDAYDKQKKKGNLPGFEEKSEIAKGQHPGQRTKV